MPGFGYRYELRHGEAMVATGHLMQEQPLEVGRITTRADEGGDRRPLENRRMREEDD